MSQEKFERCIHLNMKINGTSEFPILSIHLMSVSTSSLLDIYPYLCLPRPIHSLHFGIRVFRWCIAVNAMLRGINKILRAGWRLHQPSHAADDVSTLVVEWVLLIDIPFHILESV
jgi:hypothetical protein